MSKTTSEMIKGWLEMHNGNVEQLARWMAYTVRVAGIRECRKLIAEASA